MKIAIIGGNNTKGDLAILDIYLMNMIESSGVYLFNIIGGYVGSPDGDPPLSQTWAKYRGLPFSAKKYKSIDSLIEGISHEADYIVFMNVNTNQIAKRFLMHYKGLGKHGMVI